MTQPSDQPAPYRDITLQDIADRCGVTRATVSMALRHRPGIAKATRERILAMAAELGYDTSSSEGARRLALRKSGTWLPNYVLATLTYPQCYCSTYGAMILGGIQRGMRHAGYTMVLEDAAALLENSPPSNLRTLMNRREIDGVIVIGDTTVVKPVLHTLPDIKGMAGRPIVSVIFEYYDTSSVIADEGRGAYQATQHLLDLGHRHLLHIVFATPPGMPHHPNRRIFGASQALLQAGLDPAQHLHLLQVTDSHDISPDNARTTPSSDERSTDFLTSLTHYLHAHPEITAILALNDPNAARIFRHLQRDGYRIPADISLIGFDDTDPIVNELGENILTTVRLPLAEMGEEAVRVLQQRLDGALTEDVLHVLPTTLILRGSTASAAI